MCVTTVRCTEIEKIGVLLISKLLSSSSYSKFIKPGLQASVRAAKINLAYNSTGKAHLVTLKDMRGLNLHDFLVVGQELLCISPFFIIDHDNWEALHSAVQIPAFLPCSQHAAVGNMPELVIVSKAVYSMRTKASSDSAHHCITSHSTWFIVAIQ